MTLYSDGGGIFVALVLAVFLFHGDPDIADLVLEYLKQLTTQGFE